MEVERYLSPRLPDASVIAASAADPRAFTAIFDRHCEAIHRYLARSELRAASRSLGLLSRLRATARDGAEHPVPGLDPKLDAALRGLSAPVSRPASTCRLRRAA